MLASPNLLALGAPSLAHLSPLDVAVIAIYFVMLISIGFYLKSKANNPMGIHWTGIVFGLGFAISFCDWTTDFLVVQRVLAANSLRSAHMAPVIGSFFKMAVPFVVILPDVLGRMNSCTLRHFFQATNRSAVAKVAFGKSGLKLGDSRSRGVQVTVNVVGAAHSTVRLTTGELCDSIPEVPVTVTV